MRSFIAITTEAGPVRINVNQITSLWAIPVRSRGTVAQIRMADGAMFDTVESWEAVVNLIAAASEPAPAKKKV